MVERQSENDILRWLQTYFPSVKLRCGAPSLGPRNWTVSASSILRSTAVQPSFNGGKRPHSLGWSLPLQLTVETAQQELAFPQCDRLQMASLLRLLRMRPQTPLPETSVRKIPNGSTTFRNAGLLLSVTCAGALIRTNLLDWTVRPYASVPTSSTFIPLLL